MSESQTGTGTLTVVKIKCIECGNKVPQANKCSVCGKQLITYSIYTATGNKNV